MLKHCPQGAGYLKRADTDRLHEIFLKFATVDRNGEKFITSEDFVRKFLGLFEEDDYNAESVKLIAGIVDMDKDGYISFSEFQAFEGLLCVPDALYKTAFQLFDTNGNGLVAFDEFAEVMRKTALHQKLPFNMESTFVRLYFGKDKKRLVTYPEFSQFLHDFHEEYGVEAFKKCDKDGTGFISAGDFRDIMLSVKKHLLTKELNSKVINASGFPHGERKISFPYYMAFNSLLNNMELIKRVYLNATNGTRTQEVTKEEFLHSAQMMSQITPLEVDILFTLCDMIHHTNGRIVYNDLNSITPEQYFKQVTRRVAEIKAVSSPEERGVLIQILESTYRFTLGSVAGAVYPIDLVKTRMQNQRTGSFIGEVAYRNSWDCFKKVNDFVRDKFTDKKGNISMYAEILAGGCAGGSQVVFTNPLEIVKIRLQVAGEIAGGSKVRAWSVVKDLGLFGLYKGAKACLLRDVPFSAIYFPAYAHVKAKFADENGYNHPLTLLAAGAIAGIPAASLVTPADVIKTRLQVVARSGQTTYSGVIDAARKIYAEEGARAFWKGAVARVFRSSPQFGVTLVTYEILQRLFFVDFGGSRPAGSELHVATPIEESVKKPHHIGGYQVALPVLTGLETKFGISLPRWSAPKPAPAPQ
ncbi:hypothetical protein HF086_012989 [Spodoptera exigua]|uniref:EF-hand domain-containing protein n=1 Tax=Spodoptera exigua TaxID=7107 RepID=A0A922MV60_SPOEX|nr:hypothetical protein HF086_012989 [Spodoptera exigua]